MAGLEHVAAHAGAPIVQTNALEIVAGEKKRRLEEGVREAESRADHGLALQPLPDQHQVIPTCPRAVTPEARVPCGVVAGTAERIALIVVAQHLSLIHISEPTRQAEIS